MTRAFTSVLPQFGSPDSLCLKWSSYWVLSSSHFHFIKYTLRMHLCAYILKLIFINFNKRWQAKSSETSFSLRTLLNIRLCILFALLNFFILLLTLLTTWSIKHQERCIKISMVWCYICHLIYAVNFGFMHFEGMSPGKYIVRIFVSFSWIELFIITYNSNFHYFSLGSLPYSLKLFILLHKLT